MAQKPLILAVETSSRMGSVAIAVGKKMLAETTFSGPMRHSAEIFPAIERLLARFARKSQEIEHVYISVGPGSFTGLRIATTLAKTMYLAHPPGRTKIVAVDTLDVIAANVTDYMKDKNIATTYHSGSSLCYSEPFASLKGKLREESPEKIATILDAKRNQFFIAVYQHQELTAENAENAEKESKLSSALSANSAFAGASLPPRKWGAVKGWKKILPDSLMTASQFIDKFAGSDVPIWLLGDGLLYYQDKFKAKGIRFLDQKYWSPKASKVYLLGWQKALAGQFADPVTLTPNYLLRPDAEARRSRV